MATIIDNATLADLPHMFEVEQACFPSPWSFNLLQEEFSHQQSRIRVARQRSPLRPEEEKLIGFCIFWVVEDELQILQVAVSPSFQRSGVGRLLLHDVEKIAKLEQASNLYLEVRASNSPAIALYQSCDYQQAGIRKKYYRSPAEDAAVFVKKLEFPALQIRRS